MQWPMSHSILKQHLHMIKIFLKIKKLEHTYCKLLIKRFQLNRLTPKLAAIPPLGVKLSDPHYRATALSMISSSFQIRQWRLTRYCLQKIKQI